MKVTKCVIFIIMFQETDECVKLFLYCQGTQMFLYLCSLLMIYAMHLYFSFPALRSS